jgi:hypothetical protein
MPPTDAETQFAALVAELSGEPGVSLGQGGKKGFGSSALQVNGKIFAMVSAAGELVLKLPRQRVDELEAGGAGRRFDPGHGRLMKELLVIGRCTAAECRSLGHEALRFVGSAA